MGPRRPRKASLSPCGGNRVSDERPIGVFDSGVGGLTVARAILDLLPHEPLLYLGDTARFPYGPKPVDDIRRYAIEIADYLVHRDVKMLVVACNSVEVSAIDDIAVRAGIPVLGVIDPGVRAAVRATRNDAVLHSRACPLFVERVERGDTMSDELRTAARGYLVPLTERGIDTLILGCTHYPLLAGLLRMELGDEVVLVSSAEETAEDVYATLVREALQCTETAQPRHEFLTTGDPRRFQELAEIFIGPVPTEIRAAQAQPVGGGSWS